MTGHRKKGLEYNRVIDVYHAWTILGPIQSKTVFNAGLPHYGLPISSGIPRGRPQQRALRLWGRRDWVLRVFGPDSSGSSFTANLDQQNQ